MQRFRNALLGFAAVTALIASSVYTAWLLQHGLKWLVQAHR